MPETVTQTTTATKQTTEAKPVSQEVKNQSPVAAKKDTTEAKDQSADPNAGKKKYVVRDDQGQQKEVWLTSDQADAYVQKGISFEPKVSQLGRLQYETAQLLNKLKTDPASILFDKTIGHTPEAVLENLLSQQNISDAFKEKLGKWYYENVYERSKLNPEQLKALENERKIKEYEAREAKAREMMIQEENRRRAEEHEIKEKAYLAEVMKESKLPDINTPLGNLIIQRAYYLKEKARKAGLSVTPKQVVEKVTEDLNNINTFLLDNLDGEALHNKLGDKNVDKLKKYLIKLTKQIDDQNEKKAEDRKEPRKPMTRDEFFEQLQELKRKG